MKRSMAQGMYTYVVSVLIVMGLAAVTSAWAADATWNGTASAVWATNGNWSTTPVPGSGNTATFNNAGNANTTIDLGAGVTINTILFDTASAAAYTIGSGGNNAQTLTLNNNGAVTVNATATAAERFNAALVLGTDGTTQTTTFTMGSGGLSLYGNITGSTGVGTKTLVLTTSFGVGNSPYVFCTIADGAGGGKVAVTLRGAASSSSGWAAANTFSGPLKLSGDVRLQYSGSVLNVTDLTLGGGVTVDTTLTLRNDLSNINRLNSSVNVTALGNSTLYLRGDALSSSVQMIGTYSSQEGVNFISASLASQGTSATEAMPVFQIANLLHPSGSVVLLVGARVNSLSRLPEYNLGQGSGAGYAQIKATQIAGAAPSSAMINGIIPWVLLSQTIGQTWAFATYGANGFKPYGYDTTGATNDNGGTEPYVNNLAAAGTTDNVLLAVGEAVTGTKTVNSLIMAATVTGGSGNTLVLTSGALIGRGGHMQTKLDLNGRQGIVYAPAYTSIDNGVHNDSGNGVIFAGGDQAIGSGILLNADSTYTGPTLIHYGDVVARNTANSIPTNSNVRVDAGGILDIWDSSRTIGALSGRGKVTARNNGGANSTLTVGSGNGSADFIGTINNGAAGSIALTKTGSGIQTLSGSNTYQGATTVSQGTLLVNGSIASTNVTTAAGATLGGTGTVAGVVTVLASGTLSAGATNTTGTLRLSSNLLMNAGSKLVCSINGSNDYDRVVVAGSTVDLNANSGAGATLEVALGYAPRADQQFTILDMQSAGAITNVFAGYGTVDATYNGVLYTFRISTAGGTGNDVVLTVMPRGTIMSIE